MTKTASSFVNRAAELKKDADIMSAFFCSGAAASTSRVTVSATKSGTASGFRANIDRPREFQKKL
jgi:hypothetical protein